MDWRKQSGRALGNENLKAVLAIVVVVGLVLGLFFGLGALLNVSVRVVESGSMCIPSGRDCDGWLALSHVFEPTLHRGDIIIIQGINPSELNTNYPNSDIVVYTDPSNPAKVPIVHRIVSVQNISGTLYFQTKGDGNGQKWPAPVAPSEYDSTSGVFSKSGFENGVPQELVLGKVVMRIPYFGWITLLFNDYHWLLPVIVTSIALLIVLQFIVPLLLKRRREAKHS